MNATQRSMIPAFLAERPGASALELAYHVGCNTKERAALAWELGHMPFGGQTTVVQFLAGVPAAIAAPLAGPVPAFQQ